MRTILLYAGILTAVLAIAALYIQNQTQRQPNGIGHFGNENPVILSWAQINQLDGSLTAAAQNGDDAGATKLVTQLGDALKDFIAKYPTDRNVPDARVRLAQAGLLEVNLAVPGAPPREQSLQTLADMAKDASAPKDARAKADLALIVASFPSPIDGTDEAWKALDDRIDAFQKEFGDFSHDGGTPDFVGLRTQELQMLKGSNSKVLFRAVLQKLATDEHPEIAGLVHQMQATQKRIDELTTKPIEMKFTAVDGKEIDLAKLRGKVVLVHFWASWWAPCRDEMPSLVAAYKKYHKQGLEIVGISLDQDRRLLFDFMRNYGVTWPQYFDGQGWDNSISSSYGINAIPVIWLIDKKGMLAQTLTDSSAGDRIAGEVEKLLKL